jgi:hypothetical protein
MKGKGIVKAMWKSKRRKRQFYRSIIVRRGKLEKMGEKCSW